MSTPIQAGSTDQRLRCVAVLNDFSTLKTDLVAADITALAVKRVAAADVTVSVNTDDSNPDDAHTDGNIYNAGGGEYLVSVPDAAVASGTTAANLYGTWTDGGDTGFLIGDTHPLVSYDWQSSDRSLTNTAITAIRDNAVNITPLSAGVEQRVNGTNITLYLNEVKDTMISITDSEGTAIDLSALTLELAIEDHAGTDIQVIADADITISGDSSNNATFTNTAGVTASERVLHWALRDITTGSEVLARGLINVKRAADGD